MESTTAANDGTSTRSTDSAMCLSDEIHDEPEDSYSYLNQESIQDDSIDIASYSPTSSEIVLDDHEQDSEQVSQVPSHEKDDSPPSVPSMREVRQETSVWREDFVFKGKTYVYSYCKICMNFPVVCRQHNRGRVPSIATEAGTRYITSVIWAHHKSRLHKECTVSNREKSLWEEESREHPMMAAIAQQTDQLFEKVKFNMYDVYNDCKRGTLSAWSWPSRCLTRFAAESCPSNIGGAFIPFTPSVSQMQYCNPTHHRECLKHIADCGREELIQQLEEAIAVCVKFDGHVDAYQESNKHVAVSIVSPDGTLYNKFVSAEEPTQRGADGNVAAVMASFDKIGWSFLEKAKQKISGIATDGEAANTGHRGGLWAKLNQQCDLNLMTYWCSCHRSALAFKSIIATTPELSILMNDIKAVSSFYRHSGVRNKELKNAGLQCNPPVDMQRWPEYKEVRMVEFTYQLLQVFAHNLRACLVHWKQLAKEGSKEEIAISNGFLQKWLHRDRLKLMLCFLDICGIYSSLQFKFQRNQLSILDVPVARDNALSELRPLLQKPKRGGWEETFEKTLEKDNLFFGFQLNSETCRPRRSQPHSFVTTCTRSTSAVRGDMVNAAINYLEKQLEDTDFIMLAQVLDPIAMQQQFEVMSEQKFRESFGVDEISSLTSEYMPDLSLENVLSGWIAVKSIIVKYKLWETSLLTMLQSLCKMQRMEIMEGTEEILTVYSRLVALSPHNMFVERCISVYDLMKTEDRSSLQRSTLNDYMIVKLNMPPLAEFDIRKAVNKFLKAKVQRRPQTNFGDAVKFKQHRYFNGFFCEATCDEHNVTKKQKNPSF